MKFLLDNNLSPHLAHALNELAQPDGHEVFALRDKFNINTSDIDWINTLAIENNWIVISQDHFKKSNGLEKIAIKNSGLIIFTLKKAWSNQSYWNKASRLILWFPKIVNQAEAVTGGAAFSVPLNGTKFEQFNW